MIAESEPRQEPRIGVFFTWRTAILRSDLPPTTRHVLLTLSCFMNEGGESAWPSQRTLAEQTGLGYSTVREHLTRASDLGWIEKRTRNRENGAQSSNFYQATVPDRVRAKLRSEHDPPASSQQGPCQPAGTPPASQPAGPPASPPAGGVISSGSNSSSEVENTHVAENGDGSAQKAQIEELHEHFNTERQSQDPSRRALKLTDDRRRKYRARLRTYSVDEIKRAITAALADPFYRGKNEQSTRYDFPETVLKNDGAVDRHLDQGDGKRAAREERARETGKGEWGKTVAFVKRDLPEDELRELLSPAARESYLVVKADLERALVEDLDLRPVRDRFLTAYSERGARGP